jgi:two-component system response regulator GlrR
MTESYRVLIVDDDDLLRGVLKRAFEDCIEHETIFAADGEEALATAKTREVNLVVTDLQMPRMNGEQFIDELLRFNPSIPIIVMTSYGSIGNAVTLLRKGVYDYVTKPFQVGELEEKIRKALEKLKLLDEVRELKKKVEGIDKGDTTVIGRSPALMKMLKTLPSIARSSASVIIYGESGTGKEVVARAIHHLGHRKEKAFVPVNCSALPDSLLENELFGHVKGAFTDAYGNQIGLLKLADGGSLFLDEIGEVTSNMQVKLLRFIQEKEFKPLGSPASVKVDVRILAATNRDLKKAVQENCFREDLYYRLNVIPISIPPLRERKEDIPLLVNHFLKKYGMEGELKIKFSPLAMQKMLSYEWPGNVRELENKVLQIIALSESSIIMPEQMEFDGVVPSRYEQLIEPDSFKEAKKRVIQSFEASYIERLLAVNRGNISRAASQAKKHRRAFWELMKKYGIDASRYAERN